MFKCGLCKSISKPGDKINKVHSYRPKTYHNTIKIGGNKKKIVKKTSSGNEIARELIICKKCQESR